MGYSTIPDNLIQTYRKSRMDRIAKNLASEGIKNALIMLQGIEKQLELCRQAVGAILDGNGPNEAGQNDLVNPVQNLENAVKCLREQFTHE